MTTETIYQREGFRDREDYLRNLADDYEVDLESVVLLADMLGPNEDFDGLVSMVQDLPANPF